jgi:hypothetical protein
MPGLSSRAERALAMSTMLRGKQHAASLHQAGPCCFRRECLAGVAANSGAVPWSVVHGHGHPVSQHGAGQRSIQQHSNTQKSTVQHSAARNGIAQHTAAQRLTAKQSRAEHSTAEQSTAEQSTAHLPVEALKAKVGELEAMRKRCTTTCANPKKCALRELAGVSWIIVTAPQARSRLALTASACQFQSLRCEVHFVVVVEVGRHASTERG